MLRKKFPRQRQAHPSAGYGPGRSVEPGDLHTAKICLANARLLDRHHRGFIRGMVDECSDCGRGMTERQRRYLRNLHTQILAASYWFRRAARAVSEYRNKLHTEERADD
jgi:hypothetical protein